MPSSIPYDPSLVLAQVINKDALDTIEKISKAQAPADAAQDNLNALMASRRSLDMTKTELANLDIDTKAVDTELKELNKTIGESAATYARAKIKAETKIRELKKDLQNVHSSVESPVDFVKTEIKSMPLANDSCNLDVQYFSFDTFGQDGKAYSQAIGGFVKESASIMGVNESTSLGDSAMKQVSDQTSSHDIAGTLVLSINCTHKNASLLAPFILNVDKAVKVWNTLFPDDELVPTSPSNMKEAAQKQGKGKENRFSLISGMTFGSSFVGMVHILNTTTTNVSDSLSSNVENFQFALQVGSWIDSMSGSVAETSNIGNEVKSLLSTQNVSSHVTVISMGIIPSIKSNEVKWAIQQFSQFDPKSSLEAVATIQNATSASQSTISEETEKARVSGQVVAMRSATIKAALDGLKPVADASNRVLDINSMMTAMDDYLTQAREGHAGIPINYYLKDITKDMIAEMWVAKYYPGKFLAISGDDSAPAKNKSKDKDKTTNGTTGSDDEEDDQDKADDDGPDSGNEDNNDDDDNDNK